MGNIGALGQDQVMLHFKYRAIKHSMIESTVIKLPFYAIRVNRVGEIDKLVLCMYK